MQVVLVSDIQAKVSTDGHVCMCLNEAIYM